jgi:galactose mutarotase-like enzyme
MTFTVRPRSDALETLELRDDDGKGLLVLAPSRGGMATRLALAGKHLFFLDESTLRDPKANVRGGNPVLFPSPGKLEGDTWKYGTLKQHGFARNLPWEVAGQAGGETDARVTLRLEANDATRLAYPWEFVAEYVYILSRGLLRIEMRFTNRGDSPMPFGAGFHPYFHVKSSEKPKARVLTKATRAFDNVTKAEVALAGIDLAQKEVDLHLLDHGAEPCSLVHADGRTITLRGSPEFTHWVVWTLENKDFVCVEPWTCPGNALNTGERVTTLAPGETRAIWVEYG